MLSIRSFHRSICAVVAVASFLSLPTFAADDDADERIKAAEIKSKHAESAYVKSLIALEQLKSQTKVSKLEARLEEVKAALDKLGVQDEDAGFIKQWLVLGPIPVGDKVDGHDEESCKALLDRAYVDPKAMPRSEDKATIDGTEFVWKEVEAGDFAVDLSKFASDAGKENEHAAFVGLVYLTCEEDMHNVKLSIGSDDDSIWRLNGVEVVRAYAGRGVDRDQNASTELLLKKGVNVLTFTVLNGVGDSAAAARFLDTEGKAVEDIGVSITAPKQ